MDRKRYTLLATAGALLLALIVVLVAVFVIGNSTPTYGICIHDMGNPVAEKYAQLLSDALTERGYDVTVLDGKNDQTVQSEQIRSLIEDGVDGLFVSPVMTFAANEIVEQAKAEDIPVVFVMRQPPKETLDLWDKVAYVGCDIAQAGAMQGKMVLQLPDSGDINGDGVISYVVLKGPEESADVQLRTQAAITEMEQGERPLSALELVSGDGSRKSGRTMCAKLLATYGKDIEVVLCSTDAIALGALEAVEDGGRSVGKDIYLLGIDGDAEALEQIKAGKLTGTVQNDLQNQAKTAVELLVNGINTSEKELYIDYVPVTE